MNRTTDWTRGHAGHRADRVRAASPVGVLLIALLALVMGASPAAAYWSSVGTTAGLAKTGTLAAPVNVSVPGTSTGDVAVTWAAGNGGVTPEGYFVTRHSGATTTAACSSSPTSLIPATACSDTGVPDGDHSYVVTAVYRTWTATSAPSNLVTVTVTPPLLGAAQAYSVLAGTAVVSTGVSALSGNLGVSPAPAITGFPPGTVGGDIHPGDAAATAAQAALLQAYTYLSGLTADADIAGDLGGRTVTPGIYHSVAALAETGILTLDAKGDPDAIFVFIVDAAVNTAAASSMNLINGARASNVFWVARGAVTAGASSSFSGTILTIAAITLGAGTVLIGSALSSAAVTLDSNVIRFTAALPPTMTIDGGATRVTKDTTPDITGTSSAPVLSPVTVRIAGQTLTTIVHVGGTWSVTAAALLASSYGVEAKVRDPSGNGATATQALTVEVNPSPVVLGAATSYAVLAGTGVTSTGATTVTGDLGVSPGIVVSGFPPGTLVGTVHAGDQPAADAEQALAAAISDASGRAPHTQIIGDLAGRTFHAGVHHSTAALALSGSVTLDGEGNPDAVFIFQSDAAFNTAAGSAVNLVNGATASNVFWVVAGAAGTGATTTLAGTILAQGAITLGAGTVLTGRALSLTSVTLGVCTVSLGGTP